MIITFDKKLMVKIQFRYNTELNSKGAQVLFMGTSFWFCKGKIIQQPYLSTC